MSAPGSSHEVTATRPGTDAGTDAGGAPTAPPTPPSTPPALKPMELARWAWRQLTSMRTALVLLFLLALAAIPGSIVPQENIAQAQVSSWKAAHPTLTPIYEKLGLFSVFHSVWFSAIYLLLMVSLVGCIVPRLRVYWRGLRARPPRVPRHLTRLPVSRSFTVDEEPAVVLDRARATLRRKRFRVDVAAEGDDGAGAVSAERGYLREAGNLLFHVSILVVLVGFALGQLFGYKGGVIVVVGQGFSNSLSQYDEFDPGALFKASNLPPLSFTVDDFHVSWVTRGSQAGQPRSFSSDLTYRTAPGDPAKHYKLTVNHPMHVAGADVYLVGHGYAPKVTVRGADGHVAYKGPAVFLPQDSTFSSFGVIKVPDATPQQLGFQGLFLPTYGFTMARGPYSRWPGALDPVVSLLPYHGNLGLDSGRPQNVYDLNLKHMAVYKKAGGKPDRLDMSVGQTKKLPGGGSITFDGVGRWVKLQVSNSPGEGIALAGVVLGLLGLLGSLFVRPRRTWVRVRRQDGRTLVEVAGLDRSTGGDLEGEVGAISRAVAGSAAESQQRETT